MSVMNLRRVQTSSLALSDLTGWNAGPNFGGIFDLDVQTWVEY